MKKYELVETDTIGKLKRIRALRSFGNVAKGDLGGYIENETNLSHNDICWVLDNAQVYGNAQVLDNARVFGNAWVYGDAWVFGNAQVFGNMKVTQNVLYMFLTRDNMTASDSHIAIGCELHTIQHWLEHYREIGKENDYTEDEISFYGWAIYILAKRRGIIE